MISKSQLKLIQSLHQKKYRWQEKLFLVEGVKAVLELLRQRPGLVHALYALPAFVAQNHAFLSATDVNAEVISEEELQKISHLEQPNQVLAICHFLKEEQPDFDFRTGFTLYLDDIRDPGNFGTMLRLADWFGIPEIFCSEKSCELYNHKVIQSSMGAFLRVKAHYLPLEDIIAGSKDLQVYGASLDGVDLYMEKLQNGLIVIGNEANGIRPENLGFIRKKIRIPSPASSGAESLNAAMAASIITAEFFRQLRSV